MHWSAVPIHFIDFEGSLSCGVIEFGVVTLQAGQIKEAKTRLCRASGRIRPEDVAVHGLAEEAVAHAAPFAEDFALFAALRECGPLAAHFAHVENSLLKAAWPYPRVSPDFGRPGLLHADWGPWLDTGRLYGELYPTLATTSLSSLVTVFELQPELDQLAAVPCPKERQSYHSALYDAIAGALLLNALVARAEFSSATIPWLLQMSTSNPRKRDALRQAELF
jgi:DNA polymerase-3 subunit epsilon